MNRHKKAVVFSAIGLTTSAMLAACGGSGSGSGDSVTLKMAIPTGLDAPIGRAATYWAEAVEEESDGRITVDIFDSGSLVPGTEILAATQDGRVDVGIVPNAYHPDLLAAMSVISTPYVTDSTIVDMLALEDLEESNETLKSEYEELGVVPQFYVGSAAAMMVTKEPVKTLDDIKGLTLRALATTDTMVKPLGASGSFLEFADIYESLQRGVIDGVFPNDVGSAASASFYEVAPYFTITGQGTYTVSAAFVSQDTWDDLDDEAKAAIEEANASYIDWIPQAYADYEAETCDKILDAGAEVSILPQEERDKWQAMVEEPVNDLLVEAAETGGISADDFRALQDEYKAAAEKYEGSTVYEDGLTLCAQR